VILKVLSRLFSQYDDGKRLTFGSRFMTYVGNRMLGTLSENGIEVSPSIAKDYYNIKEDRFLPASTNKDVLAVWKRESILVCQLRQMTAPRISLSVSIVSMALVLAIVGVAGVGSLMISTTKSAASAIGIGNGSRASVEECRRIAIDAHAGRIDSSKAEKLLRGCDGVIEGGAE
jgi:hypothetical protein